MLMLSLNVYNVVYVDVAVYVRCFLLSLPFSCSLPLPCVRLALSGLIKIFQYIFQILMEKSSCS